MHMQETAHMTIDVALLCFTTTLVPFHQLCYKKPPPWIILFFPSLFRGDVIIAKSPFDPSMNVCKRVIGLEGDKVCTSHLFKTHTYVSTCIIFIFGSCDNGIYFTSWWYWLHCFAFKIRNAVCQCSLKKQKTKKKQLNRWLFLGGKKA